MTPSLVLGSSSEYRQKQLQQFTKKFTVMSPDIDETAKPGESAKDMALRLSKAKALATYAQILKDSNPRGHKETNTVIICSDQTAALDSWILGKPITKEAAFEQLRLCSGNTVTFHSAVSVLNSNSKRCENETNRDTDYEIRSEIADTHVQFRNLGDSEIARYIERDEPLNCAGSFKCESLGIALFDSISSSDPSALIGLPLISVARILRDMGISVIEM